MGKYIVDVENEDEPATCPECDGSGKGEGWEYDEDSGEPLWREDCKVCSGFGRLDW